MKVTSTSFMFYCNMSRRRREPSSKNLIPGNFTWHAYGLHLTFLMQHFLLLAKLSQLPARGSGF